MEECKCKCGCRWKMWAGLVIVGLLGAGILCYICSGKKSSFADCTLVDNAKDHMRNMKKDTASFCKEAGEMGEDLKEDVAEAVREKAEDAEEAYDKTKHVVKEHLRRMQEL